MIDPNEIRAYASLMKELDITKLEVSESENGSTLRIERASVPAQLIQTPVQNAVAADSASDSHVQNVAGYYTSVRSPIVGVFYASPAENADPFVTLGDRVEKGDVLCIVEAMKLMNEICAEESGVIEKICVTNGQVVEYGTELFRIGRN